MFKLNEKTEIKKRLLNGYFFTKYFVKMTTILVFSVNFRTVFLLNKKHSSRLLCRPAVKQTQKRAC